jgi:putative transposase
MCQVLEVSRSGYYAWRKREASALAIENEAIVKEMKVIFAQSKQSYGSPRMCAELCSRGWTVSRPRVARLMRKEGLKVKAKRRFVPATTDSNHGLYISPDLLKRSFEVGEINRAWVSDITYIHTLEGWLYLTTVMDLGDRRIIGWATSKTMEAKQTTVAALKMATANRKPAKRTIFHSDRGVQYACREFRKELKRQRISRQSMSRKANCWDNAVAESFFKSVKKEWLYTQTFASRNQAQLAVFEYVETWYNTRRRHSALGMKSPQQFSLEGLLQKQAA